MTKDYRKTTIDIDAGIAKKMGTLMELTNNFVNQQLIQTHSNRFKEWAISSTPDRVLAFAPVMGDHRVTDPYQTGFRFVEKCKEIGDIISAQIDLEAIPVAYANTADWGGRGNEEQLVQALKTGLLDASSKYKMFCAGGESAVLQSWRIPDEAIVNMSGAVTLSLPRTVFERYASRILVGYNEDQLNLLLFDPLNYLIEQRCDGNGNKPRLNMEMMIRGKACSADTIAMVADDIGKKRTDWVGLLIALETGMNPETPDERRTAEMVSAYIDGVAQNLGEWDLPVNYSISSEDITGRIDGFGNAYMNPTATAVARISEHDFMNPPTPNVGDVMLFMKEKGNENGRSNGWTQIISDLVQYYGSEGYASDPDCAALLELAGNGSTIYHKAYQAGLRMGATRVGHISGGGEDEKLSKDIGKFGFGGNFTCSWKPYELHRESAMINDLPIPKLADKYSFGFTGWMTVSPDAVPEVRKMLDAYNILSQEAGILKASDSTTITFTHDSIGKYPGNQNYVTFSAK